MTNFIRSLVLALVVGVSLGTSAMAAGCENLEGFLKRVQVDVNKLFTVGPEATTKINAKMNEIRAKHNLAPIEVGAFYMTFIGSATTGVSVGLAAFGKDGCVIDDTIEVVSVNTYVEFMTDAGVDPKEFKQMGGA